MRRLGRRAWHSWYAFLVRYYIREAYRAMPGPWYVKIILLVATQLMIGPFDELVLFGGIWLWNRLKRSAWFRARFARATVDA